MEILPYLYWPCIVLMIYKFHFLENLTRIIRSLDYYAYYQPCQYKFYIFVEAEHVVLHEKNIRIIDHRQVLLCYQHLNLA